MVVKTGKRLPQVETLIPNTYSVFIAYSKIFLLKKTNGVQLDKVTINILLRFADHMFFVSISFLLKKLTYLGEYFDINKLE